MRALLSAAIALAALAGVGAWAQSEDEALANALFVEADSLDQFLWTARPVVVFAETPNDPRFIKQVELLRARPQELLDRDVVVILDTEPGEPSEIRRQLRPRGFMLALVGKDGQVKLRKPAPWDVREITRSIDKTPLRQQEIRDALRAGSG